MHELAAVARRCHCLIGYLPCCSHAIISPSEFNSYGSSVFPGLTDLLYGFEDITNPVEKERRREDLSVHISDLMVLIKAAADFLDEIWKIV